MQPTPLVSIIIPCHNAERFIAEAIESALAQKYPNLQIIAIDDESTDNSWDVIQRYADRIQAKQVHRSGAPAARNEGLRLARGELIQFLDADDLIAPQKIACQVCFMLERKLNVCYSDCVIYNVAKQSWHPIRGLRHEKDLVACFLKDNRYNAIHSYLYQRDCINRSAGWNPDVRYQDDRLFNLTIAISGARAAYLPGVFATWRQYEGISTSRMVFSSKKEAIIALKDLQLFYIIALDLLSKHSLALPKYLRIISGKVQRLERLECKLERLPDFEAGEYSSLKWSHRYLLRQLY